jgi:hypothetical protein
MSQSDWKKVKFEDFINEYGTEMVINNAPTILYTKKDKEHEAFSSLIVSLFISGALLIYISLSVLIPIIFIGWIITTIFIIIVAILDVILIFNYIKSNVTIKPVECWFEVFEGISENSEKYFCFQYYPIFSGISHPNEAKDIIHKIFLEQVFGNTINITQIELYLKFNTLSKKSTCLIGYHYQYGEGIAFNNPLINPNVWKFFSYEKSKGDNYISVANWFHQYEWRYDLALDYDKLEKYAPWVIKRWDKESIKPLSEESKKKLKWDKRNIDSHPKLEPWRNLEIQSYEDPIAKSHLNLIEKAIDRIIGEKEIEKYSDIKDYIKDFQIFFRENPL